MNQKPTQKVLWPNVALTSLPQFETSLDTWFGRKNIPVWITEYGNETKPGEPTGVTEAQQAVVRDAGDRHREEGQARADVHLVRDARLDRQPLAERHLPEDGAAKPAQPKFAAAAEPAQRRSTAKLSVKGGTKNPAVTVYLRSFCANNPVGAKIGITSRDEARRQAGRRTRSRSCRSAIDCTVAYSVTGLTVAKGKTYTVAVEANTKNGDFLNRTITIVGA